MKEVAEFLGISADEFGPAEATTRHASTGEARLSDRGRRLKHHQLSSRVIGSLPSPVRRFAGRWFRTTLERKPEVSAELRTRLHRLVEDDVAQVEEWLGRPVDVWSRRS